MCNWRGVFGQVGQDVRCFGVIVCVGLLCNSEGVLKKCGVICAC